MRRAQQLTGVTVIASALATSLAGAQTGKLFVRSDLWLQARNPIGTLTSPDLRTGALVGFAETRRDWSLSLGLREDVSFVRGGARRQSGSQYYTDSTGQRRLIRVATDSLAGADAVRRRATSAVLALGWARSRWSLTALCGQYVSGISRRRPWLGADAALAVRDGLSVVANLRSFDGLTASPSRAALGVGVSASAALLHVGGVSLRSRKSADAPRLLASRAEPVADFVQMGDAILIRLRLVGTHDCKLASDLSSWSPMTMASAEGECHATIEAKPGVHRLRVSIDGGPWIAPEGLARSSESFGGASALLVIQ